MKAATLRLGVLGLLVVLVGVVGVRWLQRRQGELRQLESRVRSDLESNQRKRQALRTARPAAPPPAAAVATTEVPPASNLARGKRLSEGLRAQPEYAPFRQRQLRRQTLRQYGDLFAELKLSPERAEALKRILDERLGGGVDLLEIAYQLGYAQGSPEYGKLIQQHLAAAQAAIESMLSAEEKAVFRRYEASAGWRNSRQPELDEFVADRGQPPLTPAQKQALVAAYSEALAWKPNPAEGKLTKAGEQRRRSEQMCRLAAAALDPQRRSALAAYLDFNDFRGEIMGNLFFPDRPRGSMVMTVSVTRP